MLWRRRRLVCASILAAVVCTTTSAHAAEIRTVALSGQNAPGTTSGVNYAGFGFSGPALNESGRTAFYATLAGSGVDTTNEQGIWSEGSGSLMLVARTGSQAPGARWHQLRLPRYTCLERRWSNRLLCIGYQSGHLD